MGFFEKIFPNKKTAPRQTAFEILNGYSPVFYGFGKSLYEVALVRSSIDARARHCSKLRVEFKGTAKPELQAAMRKGPNGWQTWMQFIYRLSTILDNQNTAIIVPVFDEFGRKVGIFPVMPSETELVGYEDAPWLRMRFKNGKTASIELSECGLMTRFQYEHDFFGESNQALTPTMDLISIQDQGIKEGVKSSASYRFIAKTSNFTNEEDLKNERERFNEKNLKGGGGGVLLFPNTYDDIRQVDSKPYVPDAETRKAIQNDVYAYYGVNEEVLQNKAYGDAWSAFYEGAIEPFAIQFSEVLTRMLFSEREILEGNMVMATANRLQYMTNKDKLQVSTQLADRGVMNRDEARDIWNLPPLPDGKGQEYIIRGEYYNADEKISKEDGNGDE